MDREEYGESTEKILDEGIICKSAEVENQDVTEEEIKKINKLKKGSFFIFEVNHKEKQVCWMNCSY